jgi:hypothetical protein
MNSSREAQVIEWFNSLSDDVQWSDLNDAEREGAFEAWEDEQ